MPLLAVLAAGGGTLWLTLTQRGSDDARFDEDLCPATASGPSGLAVLLFDLTKPLHGLPPGLPGQMLRELTLELERDTEVRTYLLTGSSSAPRVLVKRLCKPFDTDAVQVAPAKDHHGGTRDCDDLPAQMAADQRRYAARFCALREAIESRLDTLAQRASQDSWEVTGAHMVEALDQTQAEFLSHGGSRRVLYVFSDMMQHADWYSHLDQPAETWSFDDYVRLRDSSHRLRGRYRWGGTADIDVHIHYVPREGLTDQPEAGDSHRRFWRRFFGAEQLTFHSEQPLPAYAWMPLIEPAREDAVQTAAAPTVPATVEDEQPVEMLEIRAPEPVAATLQPAPLEPDAPAEQPVATTPQEAPPTETEPADEPTVAAAPQQPPTPDAEAQEAQAAAPQSVPDDPLRNRSRSPLPREVNATPITAQAVEDAPANPQTGLDPRMDDAGQALAVETEARTDVRECSQNMLLGLLGPEEGGCAWCPEYPRGGYRNLGDAQLAVAYIVNENGEVKPESIRALEQESVLDRPGYFDMFARQAVATVQGWRFPLDNSEGRVCTPRPSGYRIMFSFEF
ncbi:MAG: hypothetical protein OXU70_08430 [Gammaproteobacteria bacterium]|nr:hypothetical protein [Gammaproteobacteria bacterium]